MKRPFIVILAVLFLAGCQVDNTQESTQLRLEQDGNDIRVLRAGSTEPIITQNAQADHRPFLHPIVAPDGKGLLTEYSPGHHPHQTGLYWGFTQVNGRDFFHHPEGDYWKRVSADVITGEGEEVQWRTVYQMLNEEGEAIMEETQSWTMHEAGGKYFLQPRLDG